MALFDANIVEIERYLRDELSPQERASFERQLAGDADLREEVAVYRRLLEGMEALRSEELAEKMGEWEEDILLAEEEEIERYLLGTIQLAEREHLERRLARDPAYAQRVEKTRLLLEGFQAMRSDVFSEDLRRWDGEETGQYKKGRVRRLPLFTRVAVAAGFLLVLLAGLRWYASANYGDAALLQAYYEAPPTGSVLGEDQGIMDRLTQRFEYAHELLQTGNYREAVTAFEELRLDLARSPVDEFTRSYLYDNATYSRALALLGAQAPDGEVRAALQQVIENPDSDYQVEAMLLQQKLDSFWRKVGS